jgi:3-(3-hydroxy-phenyl)propionate hydroxylase
MTVYDVAIVGYGPVGAILANLLGRDGHSALVVDQMLDIYGKPRAINIDHEVMRVLQSVGLAESVEKIVSPHLGTDFLGIDDRLIKVFNPIEPPYPLHWQPNLMFIQPEFEPILRDGAARFPTVDIRLGCKALRISQNSEGAALEIERGGQPAETLKARYLIACDGAASPIRKQLGIEQDSLGFDEWWTVVDAWQRRPTQLPKRTTQFCLPSGPTTYVVGPRELRRWEIKLLPGETPDDFEDHAVVRRRLAPFVDPEAIDLWRVATYRFHALIARQWRLGRIFLAGDAAHQMPPFMAQGLCCGVRDVANLRWKLNGVLRGAYPERLLDSYEVERKPHIRQLVATAKHLGEIIGELDVEKARARDALLGEEVDSGRSITVRQKLIPDLTAGIIAHTREGGAWAAAGSLFLQPEVIVKGERRLLDDVLGERFAVIAFGRARADWLDARARRALKRLGGAEWILLREGEEVARFAERAFSDATGNLERWMKAENYLAIVVRPDKFVFGAADSAESLCDLCLSLEAMVFGEAAHA